MKSAAARGRWAIVAVAVVVLIVSLVIRSAYYQLVLTQVLLWAVLSLAWNILSGYSGYFSFGHAAFWGLGAYTVTLGMINLDLTPWLGIPLAAAVGGLAGAVIGYPTFRLRGHYFALAMLAYPLAMLYVFQWLGYQEVSLPMKRDAPLLYMQFADQRAYIVLALGLLVVALAVSLRVENSRFGMALLAIKQNEPAAEAAGIDTWRWKMRAIMLGARRYGGRALRRGVAGRDAGKRFWHVGFGTAVDFGAVRRRRQSVGAGHRCGGAGPAGRGAERRTRRCVAGDPGCGLRRCHHPDNSGCAGGRLLAPARPLR
jgi:Branched-chain amino acid transport system / permease component